jgi:transposase InsO family protein
MCAIPARSAIKFICGLVCRFGVPNHIITDNGNQFTSGLFREYCASVGIKIRFASDAHPISNGQAERANTEVLKGLKTRSFHAKLEACGKKWLDNLQSVLWSICTSATKPTEATPFFLVYHSRHIRARTLEVSDLVLRRILSCEGLHKLSPMWEGPFKVTHIARPGSTWLESIEGVLVGNPWNISHLRKFYP